MTYPFAKEDVVVLVPRKKRLYKNPFNQIPPNIWILIIFACVLLIIYLRKANKSLSLTAAFMLIMAILVGKPVKEIRAKYFRIVFMSAMFLIFYVSAGFNSIFTSFLAVPKENAGITSLVELANTDGIKIKLRRGFYRLLNTTLDAELREDILSKTEVMLTKPLNSAEISRCTYDYYVCTRKVGEQGIREGLLKKKRRCYEIMQEVVVPGLSGYSVAYGLPFLERINDIVSKIVESGLYEYWTASGKWTRVKKHRKPEKLSLPMTKSSFVILLIGLLLSMIVFVFEFVRFKLRKASWKKNSNHVR